jgi:Protein of unknown function (DUF2490)
VKVAIISIRVESVLSTKVTNKFGLIGFGVKSLHITFAEWLVLACLACAFGHAQATQFLPEIDTHFTVDSKVRFLVQAKDDREGGDPQQFTFGPSIQFYLKPLLKLKHVTVFDLDDVKQRVLVIESGYRIITAPNTPLENRVIESVTFHLPIMLKILLSDRNRADLDWQAGTFSWRFRNKLTAERTVPISSYHIIPYVAAEPFYESKYGKWSSTDLYAGCRFPAGRIVQFDLYYEHENNTGKSPNQQNNFFGVNLNLFFFSERSAPSK